MVTVVVDNNPEDLEKLCGIIRENYPEMILVGFLDPLLAFKYSISNPVDALYTSVRMKRLSGLMLEKMIREDHPGLFVCFISDGEVCLDEVAGYSDIENTFGYVVKPVTTDKLIKAESGNKELIDMRNRNGDTSLS